MNGGIEEWMDGRIGGWMVAWMDGWMDRRMGGCMDRRMDGWMDNKVYVWMDEVWVLWWDSHELLVWAPGQPWGSKWWAPRVEFQVIWCHDVLPSSALFPLLLLGCSANFTGLYQFSLFYRHIGLLNEVLKFVTNLVNEVLSLVTEYEVSPPLLGVQSQAWWRQVWLSMLGCTLWTLSFLRGQLPFGLWIATYSSSLSLAWGGGEQEPKMSWNHWSYKWMIYHTHGLPAGLLANIFLKWGRF